MRSSNEKGIHPENYRTVLFYDSNAKQGFLIRSCAKTNNTMKWEDGNEYPVFMCDTSSASHPFYTGKTRQIGNEGRASEFANRYGKFGAFKSK
ncbi:MAG: type B 50S ribosomal protein L31 [Haemophilus parainfluenzae]